MNKKSILPGIIGGILISIPLMFGSFLPHIEFQNSGILLILSILFSGSIVAWVLLYKNCSFKSAALRFLVMVVSCYITIRFLAYAHVFEAINGTLCIQENDANDRASGLGIVFVLIPTLCESAIIGIALLVKGCWEKLRSKSI